MTINVITIAIKFDFGWTIDTYTRWLLGKEKDTNKKFTSNFMNEYAGTGVEEVLVLEISDDMYAATMIEVESIIDDIRKKYEKINETILNY